MLTSRGWWLLVFLLTLLGVTVVVRLLPLILVCLTLVTWFGGEWVLFAWKVLRAPRLIQVRREVRDERGLVSSLWTGRAFEVRLTIVLGEGLDLPYVRLRERVPFSVEKLSGDPFFEGAWSEGQSIERHYRIRCPAPGRTRFEGLALEIVDLQGLFYQYLFIPAVAEYRVLPPLVDTEGQPATVKRFNLLPSPGQHRHPRPGSGSELLDLRDYLPGDPPKTIAWKVSARRDRLITKEFESEVPVRCTLFLDTSNSVRVGPPGQNALTRLIEIGAAVSQAANGVRDQVGLCMFDERSVSRYVRPARGPRHLVHLLNVLADAGGLAPANGRTEVGPLLRLAYAFAEVVYPHWLRPDLNAIPSWLQWVRPQPASTKRRPTLADRLYGRLPWLIGLAGFVGLGLSVIVLLLLNRLLEAQQIPSWVGLVTVALGWLIGLALWQRLVFPQRRRWQRWRKRLAALLSVRYGLGPGGLALLLEDDEQCALYLQRFLAEHHVPYALPYYDERGRYRFASAAKLEILAAGLLRAIGKGHDNELFVLLLDFVELSDQLDPILSAVKIALARHHQVMVICPWSPGVAAPPSRPQAVPRGTWPTELEEAETQRLHQAYWLARRRFTRLGVSVLCARSGDPAQLILDQLGRLRVPGEAAMIDKTLKGRPLPQASFNLYSIACLAAQGILLALVIQRVNPVYRAWSLFPFAVGVLGVLFRWRSAPLLYLLALAGYFYVALPRGLSGPRPSLADWGLSAAVLAYVLAHYRLQGVTVSLFPPDPRRKKDKKSTPDTRPAQAITSREGGQYLLAIALWAAVGQLVFRLLPPEPRFLQLPVSTGRLVLLTWLIVVVSLVVAGVLGYARQARMSREEAQLFLQDTLWRDTRREQRRTQQWWSWAILRQQRRTEDS